MPQDGQIPLRASGSIRRRSSGGTAPRSPRNAHRVGDAPSRGAVGPGSTLGRPADRALDLAGREQEPAARTWARCAVDPRGEVFRLAEGKAASRALERCPGQLGATGRTAPVGPIGGLRVDPLCGLRPFALAQKRGELAPGLVGVGNGNEQVVARRRPTRATCALPQMEGHTRVAQAFGEGDKGPGLVSAEDRAITRQLRHLGLRRPWRRARGRGSRVPVLLRLVPVFELAAAVGAGQDLRPVLLAAIAADAHVHGQAPSRDTIIEGWRSRWRCRKP